MRNVIGIDGAGPIWHDFMEFAEKGKPAANFTKPANIVTMQVSAVTGLIPNPGEPSYNEVFVKGTEPKQKSSFVPTPSVTVTREQAIATATAVSAYATAAAQGTALPAGVSLTPPAIPTPEPTLSPTAVVSGTPQASASPLASTTPRPAGSKVTVPNVVSLPLPQAEVVLKGSGVAPGAVSYANPPGTTYPVGAVMSQSPSAGTQVDASSGVSLIVRR
jgi:membrane carboxypeptidase/penicillin-binding protein PbpC